MPRSERIRKYARDFGIDQTYLQGLVELKKGDDVWIGTKGAMAFNLLRVNRRGMRGFRIFKNGYKPTTNLIQLTGKGALRRIELDEMKANRFIRGLDLEIVCGLEPGYVIVSYLGFPLGIGKYRDGILKNQIPRAKRIRKNID